MRKCPRGEKRQGAEAPFRGLNRRGKKGNPASNACGTFQHQVFLQRNNKDTGDITSEKGRNDPKAKSGSEAKNMICNS